MPIDQPECPHGLTQPVCHLPYAETRVTAGDAAEGQRFGEAVAVDGDRIVVSDPFHDGVGSNAGAVYVYDPDGRGGWTETRLTASDGTEGDWFGSAVAVSGDRIVVGAPLDDDQGSSAGAVYVYEADGAGGWSQTKLTASDALAGQSFGEAVAVDGDRIVVGAVGDDEGGTGAGATYIYEPDGAGGWSEVKLVASNAGSFDRFGWSVAVDGDRVVVGAPFDHLAAWKAGTVYVYELDRQVGWAETKLNAYDAEAEDWFGYDVDVDGPRVLVGAIGEDEHGTRAGAAYLFVKASATAWTPLKITAEDANAEDRFGFSVALDGPRTVVGAIGDDQGGTDAGATYVFEPDLQGQPHETKLVSTYASKFDRFGWSVAVDGGRLVVGVPTDDGPALSSGAAYLYQPLWSVG